MKTIKIALLALVVIFMMILIGSAIYKIHYRKKQYDITCSAQYHIFYDYNQLLLSISVDISENFGRMVLSGYSSTPETGVTILNRSITFDVKKRGNIYTFNNSKIQPLNKDNVSNDAIRSLLAPFFYMNNKSLNVKIYPQNNRDYVFLFSRTPAFYCSYYD